MESVTNGKKNNKQKGELKKVQLEVQAMKRLSHPNIVELVDFRETTGYMFLVMEYCSKGDLLEYVQSKERLSEVSSALPVLLLSHPNVTIFFLSTRTKH